MAKLTIFRFRGHISREERFRQLFVEIYPRLLRYAIQLMSDREEAKDIVGEVMEEAWKCFDRLEAETQNAYFYTATRNTCLNRLKHLLVEQQHFKKKFGMSPKNYKTLKETIDKYDEKQ